MPDPVPAEQTTPPPSTPSVDTVPKAEFMALKAELEAMKTLMQFGRSPDPAPSPDPLPSQELDDETLENLSRADLMKLTESRIMETLEKSLGPLVKEVRQDIAGIKAKSDVDTVSAKHPDFWTYRDAMYAIAQSTPGLKAEQVYQLAKAQAQALTAEEVAKRDADAAAAASLKPSTTPEGFVMLPKGSDAAKTAWKDVFGDTQAIG